MIIIVTTHSTRGTHKKAAKWPGAPRLLRRTYWSLFHRSRLPRATYILTDFDRLSPWELELAASLYRKLQAAGLRVLNDPALFRPRHAMQHHLRQAGLNSFQTWSPVFDEFPDRFPVFLRTQAAHRGPLSDLLQSAEEAQQALTDALAAGQALADLMFVEYAAETEPNGIFIKYSAYRIGDVITPNISTMSLGWVAKIGDMGCATDEQYEHDLAKIADYPYTDQVMAVFKALDIDYGRIDFGFLNGRMETYEINTNPFMGMPMKHPVAVRLTATHLVIKKYIAGLNGIDIPRGGQPVRLDGDPFKNQRRRDRRRLFFTRWLP